LMLGNQVELWEMILAAMKLGAVVVPATTLLARADLADRIEWGRASHVVVAAAEVDKTSAGPMTFPRPRTTGSAHSSWKAR